MRRLRATGYRPYVAGSRKALVGGASDASPNLVAQHDADDLAPQTPAPVPIGGGSWKTHAPAPRLDYNTRVHVRRSFLHPLLGALLAVAGGGEIPALPPLQGDLQGQYDAYIAATEARIRTEVRASPYLWSEQVPERWVRVRRGEVVVQPRHAHSGAALGNGLLHDWIGAIFVPGATLAQAISVLQDCGRHKDYYRPEVIDCQVTGHTGNYWNLRYRVVKRYFITVVANTDQSVEYEWFSSTRAISQSVATRIAEVKAVGKPAEREIDPRKESTIVWRLNTYWRLEEKDGASISNAKPSL